MKMIARKCQICKAWYGLRVHKHCPYCGTTPIAIGRKMKHFNFVTMRAVSSVSAKTIPTALFRECTHDTSLVARMLPIRHIKGE